MTDFMLGTPLSVPPYLQIERKVDGLTPGTIIPFTPPLAGAPKKLRFNQDLTMMVMASEFRRADIGGLGNPSFAFRGPIVYAPDDNYILACGLATQVPLFVRKQGPYYLPVDGLPLPTVAGAVITAADISKDGNTVVLVRSDDNTKVKIYNKTTASTGVDTWTLSQEITVTANTVFGVKLSKDGKYLFLNRNGSSVSLFYKASATFAAVVIPGTISATNKATDCVFTAAGASICFFDNSGTASVIVYDVVGGVPTARTSLVNPQSSVVMQWAKLSPNGENLAFYVGNSTSFQFRIYKYAAGAWVSFANDGPSSPGTSQLVAEPIWSPTGLFVTYTKTSGSSRFASIWKLNAVSGATSAAAWVSVSPFTATMAVTEWLFAADETFAVCYGSVSGAAATPLGAWNLGAQTAITTLPFFGSQALSTMLKLALGRSGKFAMNAVNSNTQPTWTNVAVRDGAGDYLSLAALEGTFVSVHDLVNGIFVERDFTQHIVGSIVSDIVIAPNNKAVLYDIRRTDGGLSGLGRYAYDLSDAAKMVYRGVVQVSGDISTLAAISTDSIYFALSVRNPAGNNLKLYKFNSDYSFVLKDTDLEDYGPPTWTLCDTVLVAHGGVQPYSLYQHVLSPDTLVEQAINIPNWDNESQIVFVAATPDCKGVIIIDENDGATTISDGSVVATEPGGAAGGSSGSGGGGGASAGSSGGGTSVNWPGGSIVVDNNDKTITNLNYIDYTATSVTPRTWL